MRSLLKSRETSAGSTRSAGQLVLNSSRSPTMVNSSLRPQSSSSSDRLELSLAIAKFAKPDSSKMKPHLAKARPRSSRTISDSGSISIGGDCKWFDLDELSSDGEDKGFGARDTGRVGTSSLVSDHDRESKPRRLSATLSSSPESDIAPARRILNTLSSSVGSHNRRAFHVLSSISEFPSASSSSGLQKSTSRSDGWLNHLPPVVLNEHEFYTSADSVVSRIGALMRDQDCFTGSATAKVQMKQNGPKNDDEGNAEDEAKERLQERLEAYKMVRKIEPETPPLVMTPAGLCREFDNTIARRNCTRDAVFAATPGSKEVAIRRLRQKMNEYRDNAIFRHETQMEIDEMRWVSSVEQKRKRVEMLRLCRRENGRGIGCFDPQRWLTLCVLVGFLDSMRTLKDDGEDDVSSSVPAKKRASLAMRMSVVASRASCVHSVVDTLVGWHSLTPDRKWTMRMIASVFKIKCMIHAKRRHIKVVHRCMSKWMPSGVLFICVGRFRERICFLQAWWRRCAKNLWMVRDRLSKRWAQLEKAELLHDILQREACYLNTRQNINTQRQMSTVDSAKKPLVNLAGLEERAELGMMAESVRLDFLDHELRARRYRLLPALAHWVLEVKHWRNQLSELKDAASVASCMNLTMQEVAPSFSWPPARPSYLPPAHPRAETTLGLPCGEGCPGRRGDAELLAMWRAAKKHQRGGGWQKIPQSNLKFIRNCGKNCGADHPKASLLGGNTKASNVGKPWGSLETNAVALVEKDLKDHLQYFPGIDGPAYNISDEFKEE